MPSVSIHLVTYNDKKYLPDCLQAVFNLQLENEKGLKIEPNILIVDNASTDGTVEYLKEFWPQIPLVVNRKNEGYCRAHNKAIHFSKSDYILVMNADTLVEKDFLIKLVEVAEDDETIGAIGGMILKAKFNIETLEIEKTNLIDSLGIGAKKSRRFYDIGAGQSAFNQNAIKDEFKEVFGVTGALVLFRRVALEDIRFEQEFFDEDIFAYKDDIDICWRLRLNGWRCGIVSSAQAYHFRAVSGGNGGVKETINGRKDRSYFVRYLSYRNHFLVIYKNADRINLVLAFPWIFFYELKKFFYVLFFETKVLKAFIDFIKLRKRMKEKRKYI